MHRTFKSSICKMLQVLEKLYRLKWGPLDGLGALVISPTRELALQIHTQTAAKACCLHRVYSSTATWGTESS